MKKLLIGGAIVLALLAAVSVINALFEIVPSITTTTTEQVDQKAEEVRPEKTEDLLALPPVEKIRTVKRSVNLEARNTVVLRGPVNGESVGKLMLQLGRMSRDLPKSQTIYLVLDTPGGSVIDGADLIDFLEALPQKVTTVTLFAASMGFQIVENNPGERLITRNGILMSHRAAIDGLGGQMGGELEARYRMYKRQIDYLETVDAKRMQISLDQYQALIHNELWIHGFDAVESKVADAEVLVTCGASMKGEDVIIVQTMFGNAEVVFDKCPLIRTPIAVRVSQVRADAKNYVTYLIHLMFFDQEKFTKEYIVTKKYYSTFR